MNTLHKHIRRIFLRFTLTQYFADTFIVIGQTADSLCVSFCLQSSVKQINNALF